MLSGCQIRGAGKITIHGKFVERESPGIVGVTQLVVSAGGLASSAPSSSPRRARGSPSSRDAYLRMKIQPKKERQPTFESGR